MKSSLQLSPHTTNMTKDDAFGQMVWDYYQRKPSFEAIEMDTGFLTAISPGPEWYFEDYEEWNRMEQKAIDKAEGKVLDIGCGAGRHSLYLQENGHEVLATDISPLALKTSRERGVKRTKNLDFNNVDKLDEEFDTVLMLGNNFGLVGSTENARNFLNKLERATTEKAKLIAEAEPRQSKDQDKHHETEEGLYYIKMRYRYKEHKGSFHRQLYVSQKELEEILKTTAWSIEETIEDSDSATYAAVITKEN